MNGSSRVALVTVLYNCEKHLSLFFECMGRQTDRDFLVAVIDNASSDASLSAARALSTAHDVNCEFIANAGNLGIAVGNNQGIDIARRLGLQHVVLINNDIACDDDLIARIRQHAICAGHRAWTCLAYYGDSSIRWFGGGRLSYWLARGLHFDTNASARITAPIRISYAPTCLMYLHLSVVDTVGPMDSRYFVYYDDTDFCRRLKDAGIPLIYDPNVSFRHYVGGSSGGNTSAFFLCISTRNKFIYIGKHYRWPLRGVIGLIALFSKLAQLTDARRRGPTLAGLREAMRLIWNHD